jgi:acid stress chaperone HdeB
MRYGICSVVALMLAAITSSEGRAQVTIDVAKITCGQFLAYRIADPKEIALWLSGYFTGKRGGTTLIDTQELKNNYEQVRSYCLVHQDTTVMQAAETLLTGSK